MVINNWSADHKRCVDLVRAEVKSKSKVATMFNFSSRHKEVSGSGGDDDITIYYNRI
jgi:hypothetical protein